MGGLADQAAIDRFVALLTQGFQGGLNLIEQLYGIVIPLTLDPGAGAQPPPLRGGGGPIAGVDD